MNIVVRSAILDDTNAIVRLSAEFDEYLFRLGDTTNTPLTGEVVSYDCFGEDPAYSGLVAELVNQVIGYLLYHQGYDFDHGGRVIYVIDIFVSETCRRLGTGRKLMETASEICRNMGGKALIWAVYNPNKPAFSFYQKIGAEYISNLTHMHLKV